MLLYIWSRGSLIPSTRTYLDKPQRAVVLPLELPLQAAAMMGVPVGRAAVVRTVHTPRWRLRRPPWSGGSPGGSPGWRWQQGQGHPPQPLGSGTASTTNVLEGGLLESRGGGSIHGVCVSGAASTTVRTTARSPSGGPGRRGASARRGLSASTARRAPAAGPACRRRDNLLPPATSSMKIHTPFSPKLKPVARQGGARQCPNHADGPLGTRLACGATSAVAGKGLPAEVDNHLRIYIGKS